MEKIIETKIANLIPDDRNANLGTEYGQRLIENSLSKFGAGRSILLDKNNRIIAGNKATENAGAIGMEDVIIVETDGKKLVAVKRTDIDLDTKEGREMALADNATSKANLKWDSASISLLKKEFKIEPKEWGIEGKKIFGENNNENRCDMKDELKIHKCGEFYYISFWKVNKDDDFPKLTEIKENPEMVHVFSKKCTDIIGAMHGENLREGDWAIITSPKRRHKENNFASECCKLIASNLKILFYEDFIEARTRERINPDFSLKYKIKEKNLFVFDDIKTTGSTLSAIYELLKNYKNLTFFVGINNCI
jgi:hypothetical protein